MAILLKVVFLRPTNKSKSRIRIRAMDSYGRYSTMTVQQDISKQVLEQARELVESYSAQYLGGVKCSPLVWSHNNTWCTIAGDK